MPLHQQIPPTHVHRLPVPPTSNGTASGSRLAHHHHGIPMPPPSVILSMPPPTVNMTSGNVMTTHAPQHIAPPHTGTVPHNNHMHIQHHVVHQHHHSPIPRTINGNQEIHHVVPQQPQGINPPPPPQLHHHGHHHPASSPHHAAPNPTPTTTTNPRHPPRTTTSKIMGNHSHSGNTNKTTFNNKNTNTKKTPLHSHSAPPGSSVQTKHPPDKSNTINSSTTLMSAVQLPPPPSAAVAPLVNKVPQPLISVTPLIPQGVTQQKSTTTTTTTTTLHSPQLIVEDTTPPKEKTPMCLINELARYNKIQHQYRLTDEAGPAHKKTFTVCLKLGDVEEYIASGPSIKKAQHAAAAIALEKTKLKHPPPKTRLVKNINITPTVELNALAMKRGEPAVYTFLDTVRPHGQQPLASGSIFRGMYNQRYHHQQHPNNKAGGPHQTSPVFRVRLTVGSVEVTGEGSTAQAAKHSAATNALLKLKEMPMPNRTSTTSSSSTTTTSSANTHSTIKSTLNPASIPFVPSNAKASSSDSATTPTTTTATKRSATSDSRSSSAPSGISISSTTTTTRTSSKTVSTKTEHQKHNHHNPPGGAESNNSKYSNNNNSKSINSSSSLNNSNSSNSNDNYSDLKSPISLVHENALKRNMTVKFEVARETGPPHMRTFITRCLVGDFVTEGEGNGKRTSKARAAELMLEKFRELPPLASCQTPPKKKTSKETVAAKKKSKNLIKLEQKANPDYGQSINPISRLIQIQQAKKQKEPVYTLISERGMPRRREFIMEVSAAGQCAQGSGPNKKLAKRAAAEALLQLMGYSRPSLQPSKPALKTSHSNGSTASTTSSSSMSCSSLTNGEIKEKTKKLTFVDQVKAGDSSRTNGQKAADEPSKIPGILYLDNSSSRKNDEVRPSSSTSNERISNGFTGSQKTVDDEEYNTKVCEPKEELQYLSQVLGFHVTYTDFPQKANNKANTAVPEFITLVKLSTKPPKVCHGKGSSREASQTDAARRALVLLADSGDIDEDATDEIETGNGIGADDSIPVVSAAAAENND